MHAVVVTVTVDPQRREDGERYLHERVVPGVSALPGFIHGYWLEPQEGKGLSIVAFESEEQANHGAEGARQMRDQSAGEMPVRIDSIEVRRVLANA